MNKVASKNSNTLMVVICYLIVYIVWGSTYFFIEKALHAFPPFVLGSIRFIVASVILFSYCGIRGYVLWDKKSVKDAIFVGFLLLFVDMAAIIWAEQHISSAIVSIIAAASAIWFIIFDKNKWKENFSSVPIIIGLVMGFGGVIMLFAEQALKSSDNEASNMKMIAMIVMILGTLGWTFGSLFSKYTLHKEDEKILASEHPDEEKIEPETMHLLSKTSWQMLTAGIAFTFSAFITGEYNTFELLSVPTDAWLHILYLAIFGSIIAFSSYLYLLEKRPATEVSTYAYVNPIVAMILAYFFTDHTITLLQIWGLVVILLSVLLMNWNLYTSSKTITALKNRRFRKFLYQKSSIPRIIDVFEIHHVRQKLKNKKQY